VTERVTKVGAEVLRTADETADLRTTNVSLEVLAKAPDAQAVFTKTALEILRRGDSNARFSKSTLEVIREATLPYPSRFSPSIHLGAFTNPSAIGLQEIHGMGFHPGGIIMAGNIDSTTIDGFTFQANLHLGVDNGLSSWTAGYSGLSPSGGFRTYRTDRSYAYNHASGVNPGNNSANVDSFDSDGITLDWVEFDDTTIQFYHFYTAFADNIKIAVGTFDVPTTNTQASVSIADQNGNAFQPDLVIFYLQPHETASRNGTSTADPAKGIGCMDLNGNQWATSQRCETSRQSGTYDNHCFVHQKTTNGDTSPYTAEFVSMDVGGFTYNMSNAPGSTFRVYYVAFGNLDDVAVGVLNAPATTQSVETSVGFVPTAIFVSGNTLTLNSTSTSASSDPQTTWAWANSSLQFSVTSALDPGIGNANSWMSTTKMGVSINSSSSEATIHEFSFTGFTATGFTMNWTKVDGNNRYFPYIAFKTPNAENPDYPVSLIADGLIMGG
jgi:hypothetical protein